MLHEMVRSEFVPDSDEKILVHHNLFLHQRDAEFFHFLCFLFCQSHLAERSVCMYEERLPSLGLNQH